MTNFSISKIKKIKGIEFYLFGGFLRDLFLGIRPSDIDLKIVIFDKNKQKKRIEILQVLFKSNLNVSITKIPNGGLLYRMPEINLDIVVYSQKHSGDIYKSSFSINSFHINLNLGKYFFNNGYLESLSKKKITHTNAVYTQGREQVLRGIYLTYKLPNYKFSSEFESYIYKRKNISDIFISYCSTLDLVLKNELEKLIFSPYSLDSNRCKKDWVRFGFLKQLNSFLENDVNSVFKKDQETFFEDRVDQLRKYAKKLRE